MNSTNHHQSVLLLVLLLATHAVYAQETEDKVLPHGTKIEIKANIIAPPACSINNDNKIEIDFGKASIKRIDGKNYRQKVNYQVKCEDTEESQLLSLKISGTSASFDVNLLNTTTSGLGIKFEQGTEQLNLNTALDIQYNNMPALYAVLVKDSSKTPLEGEFTGSATLKIEYR